MTALADRAELSKRDAKRALDALDEVVLDELGNAQKVRIGQLVQLTVRVKPAQKARTGRNPATGEEITIAAQPARGLTSARGRWRGQRRRCLRYRRHVVGWLLEELTVVAAFVVFVIMHTAREREDRCAERTTDHAQRGLSRESRDPAHRR
ncbi:MAG: HU family DNA-binding protein [Solirubrobacteraceae bacterium]